MIRILWHALDNPQKAVGKLEMVSEREKGGYCTNSMIRRDYPADKNIIRLFEEQAEDTHRPAVFYADKSMTYDVFNRRVNRLAWKLIEAGARPGDVIAVLIPRNMHALVSIYAVLKCGAVFCLSTRCTRRRG